MTNPLTAEMCARVYQAPGCYRFQGGSFEMTEMTRTPRLAALAWLERHGQSGMDGCHHARILEALLAEPRLPKEPDDKLLDVIRCGLPDLGLGRIAVARIIAHLHAHLSKPALRDVDVWYVEYAGRATDLLGRIRWEPLVTPRDTEADADNTAEGYRRDPSRYAEVKVTGPHKRQVPAT